jgi:two-component system alkaline phosphatase synthesis response regulator PhoP
MSHKKLLLIDDEADIREVATLTLETVGNFDVITADSGLAGIARAESERPDAILLDVMMPGIDGPATFKRLQASEATRSIPVIFLTAKIQAVDKARLSALGAKGIIAKPFNPMTLADEVDALLGV